MKDITLGFIIILTFTFFKIYSQSIATYNITFTNYWNVTDHGPLPVNPHWSKLVGANHKNTITFLEAGSIASQGIENIAEDGVNTNFKNDVITSINDCHSEQYIDGNGLFLSSGFTIEINGLQVSEQFPLLTLISMIAPSPDWMVFINDVNLRNSGNTDWKNSISIDLYPFDAGTDSGTNYNSPDADIPNHIAISSLQGISPFNNNKVATIDITLQNVLAINKINAFENIKIYPNPTRGEITISNPQNINIKSIQIYNVLGSLVKQMPLEKSINTIDLNLSFLNRGIYLIRLDDFGKNSKTQKLIVE